MKKKRRGFTLVELLVVIAIIALLMGILMPALAKVRQIAYRLVCGANMGGIGKAMLSYANENNESYPVAGRRASSTDPMSTWSSRGGIATWYEELPLNSFRRDPPTITSCLYLLVRTQDVTPKQFVCKGDVGTKVFTLKEGKPAYPTTMIIELQNVWDFGGNAAGNGNWPGRYQSYAYHMPFYHNLASNPPRSFPVLSSSASGTPVLADRNPYNDKNADSYIDGKEAGTSAPTWNPGDSGVNPPIPPHYSDQHKTGNSASHQREGQNVLFNDNRVSFEKYPNVGIDSDNIWKYWGTLGDNPTDQQKQVDSIKPSTTPGTITDGLGGPRTERDAYLVSEDNRRT